MRVVKICILGDIILNQFA